MKYLISFFLLYLTTTNELQSQSPCEKLLQSGLVDFKHTSIDEEFILRLASIIDDKTITSKSDFETESNNAGVGVGNYQFSYGSNGTVSYNNKTYRSFREMFTKNTDLRKKFTEETKSINVEAMRIAANCIEQQPMLAWPEVINVGQDVVAKVKRGKFIDYGSPLKIIELVPINCTVDTTKYIGRVISGDEMSINVKIDNADKTAALTIVTNHGPEQIITWRPELKEVELPTLPPTCTDGQKNGGEKGVDCGGPCEDCLKNYEVTIKTDGSNNSGTSEVITVIVVGSDRHFQKDVTNFKEGKSKTFTIRKKDIGKFVEIQVSMRNGNKDDFRFNKVTVKNLTDNKSATNSTNPYWQIGDNAGKKVKRITLN